jgi:hypothetical protein
MYGRRLGLAAKLFLINNKEHRQILEYWSCFWCSKPFIAIQRKKKIHLHLPENSSLRHSIHNCTSVWPVAYLQKNL